MSGGCPEPGPEAVLGPAPGVAWAPIGDEVVVYRVAGGASLVLNSSAGVLWQCLDNTSRLAEIFDDLAAAFGVDRAVVEQDCLPVVGVWMAERLLEEVQCD